MTKSPGRTTPSTTAPSPVQVAETLLRVHGANYRRNSRQFWADLNINHSEAMALRTLSRAETPPRMNELAAKLGVSPRTLTDQIDGLERAGYVERQPDPQLRRATLVMLTDHGRGIMHEVRDRMLQGAAHAFATLSNHERATLDTLLTKVLDAARDHNHSVSESVDAQGRKV